MSYNSQLTASPEDEEESVDRTAGSPIEFLTSQLQLAFQETKQGTRNWNEEFQQLRDAEFLEDERDEQKEFERIQKIRKLCNEFAELASSIGKEIVSELFLPNTEKTILPRTSTLGGIGKKVYH